MTDLAKKIHEKCDNLLKVAAGGHTFAHKQVMEEINTLMAQLRDSDESELNKAILETKVQMMAPFMNLYDNNNKLRHQIMEINMKVHDGNQPEYALENTAFVEGSPLKGKTVLFLGSSVTYGAASRAESFADFMAKKDGLISIKEAVSGTTLVDEMAPMGRSYVSRMKDMDKTIKADGFVCQLSTNDASTNKPLGEISPSYDMNDFDVHTVTGAMEYICAYVKENWNCPILFYTGTKYDSENYQKMVDRTKELAAKWHFDILDMWDDEEMCAVSKKDYALYMNDPIHPTRAGYQVWWTPKFEAALEKMLAK